MINNNLKNTYVAVEDVEDALRHYVRFHLQPGDLEAVPELTQYLQNSNANNEL